MSHNIEHVKHWPSGDTRIFPFVVPDNDADVNDARKDISGAEIEWKLKNPVKDEIVLELSDSGVNSNITDAQQGEFEIEVDKGATSELEGTYREILRITDNRDNRSTWLGRVDITHIE